MIQVLLTFNLSITEETENIPEYYFELIEHLYPNRKYLHIGFSGKKFNERWTFMNPYDLVKKVPNRKLEKMESFGTIKKTSNGYEVKQIKN